MKKTIINLALTGLLLSISGISTAADYSAYSNEELFGMQDQVRALDNDSRNAYRTERQSRMQSMNQNQRQSYINMGASGRKNMERMGQRNGGIGRGQGGGGGGGKQHRYGQGNGDGNQYRYGQSGGYGGSSYRNTNRYGAGIGSGMNSGSYGGSRYGSGGSGRR